MQRDDFAAMTCLLVFLLHRCPGLCPSRSRAPDSALLRDRHLQRQTATTTSWSDTSIVAVVRAGASSGPVIVTQGGVASNSLNFAIFGYHRPCH